MHRIFVAVMAVVFALIPAAQAHAAPDRPPGTPAGSRIWDKYLELGDEAFLGAPTSSEFCGLIDEGCGMRFERGLILWSPATGAHFVHGSILADSYGRNGYEAGHLGYPTSDEQCWIQGGCFQTFTGGSIYWSPGTGAHFVKGSIRERWGFEGWEAGHLGYPTSDEFCGLRAGGCFQRYQGGSIYWSPETGAHFVKGAIRDRWGTLGWESLIHPVGPQGIEEMWYAQWGRDLGYPITGEYCGLVRGGCFQNFERGRIFFSPSTGAHPVTPGINGGYWTHEGAEESRFGYPVEEEHCVGYPQSEWMCLQRFENGEELNDYPGPMDESGNLIWAW